MQKLQTYDAYNHKYIDPNGSYEEYKIWRKSDGYKVWLRKQWRIQDPNPIIKAPEPEPEQQDLLGNITKIFPGAVQLRVKWIASMLKS